MKYLPSIIAAVVAVVGMFAGPLQASVAAHPTIALILTSLYTILAHFLPSPAAPAVK